MTTAKFVWIERGTDYESGVFDSIGTAIDDARGVAKDDGVRMTIDVLACRPATAADRELFEGREDIDRDLDAPGWWDGLWVPEDPAVLPVEVGDDRSPRRDVEKQEELVAALHAFARAQQIQPHNLKSWPAGKPDEVTSLNSAAVGEALRAIMALFGYTITPIQ